MDNDARRVYVVHVRERIYVVKAENGLEAIRIVQEKWYPGAADIGCTVGVVAAMDLS